MTKEKNALEVLSEKLIREKESIDKKLKKIEKDFKKIRLDDIISSLKPEQFENASGMINTYVYENEAFRVFVSLGYRETEPTLGISTQHRLKNPFMTTLTTHHQIYTHESIGDFYKKIVEAQRK